MTSDARKLLIVDDHAGGGAHGENWNGAGAHADAALSRCLTNRGYTVETARDGHEALDKIRESKFDLVVLDQLTQGALALDLLRLLRATYSPGELPVMVVTADTADSSAADALHYGANDCVAHPASLPEVAARIETQLSRTRGLTRAPRIDGVTGLGNRAALLDKLRALLDALASGSAPGSENIAPPSGELSPPQAALASGVRTAGLLLLDLDGFRRLNTSLGETFGDGLLREAARRVEEALHSTGWGVGAEIARVGGDEFAIAGPHLSDRRLEGVAAAILHSLNQPLVVQGFRLTLSASIGIASADARAGSAEGLLSDAHLAMERARQLGGNRAEHFDEGLRKRAQSRVTLALELQNAIEQNQLFVVYQPKINLREHRLEGFEALLRWRRSNGEIVPPMDFIPVAEDTGSIREIGLWVLEEACRQLAIWQKQYPSTPPLTMNVNVSVRQLGDFHLVGRTREVLAETGIPPASLNLELTESALMSEIETARLVLEHLRALNVGLKLDDFGTGFSSLSYLRALQFDSLKIAPCFITKLATDYESRAIVESVVTLAHALNMNVVAEGIETEAQLHALEELGCDSGQGYLFYKPLNPASAADLLRRGLHKSKPELASALAFGHFHGSRLAG